MKNWTQQDLVIPCINCKELPDIKWECDDLEIGCEGLCVSIYRNCVETPAKPGMSTIDYVLEQINTWNRFNQPKELVK